MLSTYKIIVSSSKKFSDRKRWAAGKKTKEGENIHHPQNQTPLLLQVNRFVFCVSIAASTHDQLNDFSFPIYIIHI